MESTDPKRVSLTLHWKAGRIAGLIGLPDRAERRFDGYVELIAALEGIRTGAPIPGAPGLQPELEPGSSGGQA